jgi:hypothetical protein
VRDKKFKIVTMSGKTPPPPSPHAPPPATTNAAVVLSQLAPLLHRPLHHLDAPELAIFFVMPPKSKFQT